MCLYLLSQDCHAPMPLQGFLSPGTDVSPIVPALEKIWADSMVQSMANFNFRLVTSKFNDLVFEYPIRIPERYALVIRYIKGVLVFF